MGVRDLNLNLEKLALLNYH